jgi:hypothetical protein
MSELAAMLSDLHDNSGDLPQRQQPEPAPEPVRMKLPEWASEEALDAAFANWVPGPQIEASQAERALFSEFTELVDTPLSVDAPLSVDVPVPEEPAPVTSGSAVTSGWALAAGAPAPAPAASAATLSPGASGPTFGARSGPTARETPMSELMKGASPRPDDDLLPGKKSKAGKRRWFSRR